ncbi:MAG: ATP-binding protein [Sulfurimonadaceae bacterium]|nr:ATP-binding protein [Sulfurimonadaceae bacterium]
MPRIAIVICSNYYQELCEVLREYDDVDALSFHGSCRARSEKQKLEQELGSEYEKVIVIGGCSLEPNLIPSTYGKELYSSCFYMFASQTFLEEQISHGAYLVTPGWLSQWRDIVIRLWQFDQDGARTFFSDFCQRLLFLDTGVGKENLQHLKAFSEFVDLPYDVLSVGLDTFRSHVGKLVAEARAELAEAALNKEVRRAQKEHADYSMALDLVSNLNKVFDEKQIAGKLEEIFTMLFAPEALWIVTIENDAIKERSGMAEVDEVKLAQFMDSGNTYEILEEGFLLNLYYADKSVAVVNAGKIAFPQYKEYYLNLALSISVVCALAIQNARSFQKNRETEAYLAQQSKLAAMGEMLGAIAHQWRQPLNALSINIEMLEEYFENEMINEKFLEEFIDQNTKSIRFMSKTISDFRNFFRMDKEKSYFDVKASIENIIELQRLQLKKMGIEVSLNGPSISAYGYPSEFQQVILNLMNNSKDAISEKGVENGTIDITIEAKDEKTIIAVLDNGGGMAEDVIDRVFEPYFSTKEQGKGIGMGLYISKMIIEKNMDGKISAENSGSGACFTIEVEGKDVS